MTEWLEIEPSMRMLILMGAIAFQVSGIIVVALLFARTVRRHAAVRSAILMSALALVLASPFIAICFHANGITWVRLPMFPVSSLENDGIQPPAITPPSEKPLPRTSTTAPKSNTTMSEVANGSQPTTAASGTDGTESLHLVAGAVFWIWLIGMVAAAARLGHGCLVVRAFRKQVDEHGQGFISAATLDEIRKSLGVRLLPRIVTSAQLSSPVAIGIGKPMVVLPEDLIATLDDDQIRDILIHECAHVVQGDLVIGIFQRLAQIIFWPHPFVYLLNHRLTEAREQLCDNFVLQQGGTVRYAQTLVEVSRATPAGQGIGMCNLSSSPGKIQKRIEELLDEERSSHGSSEVKVSPS